MRVLLAGICNTDLEIIRGYMGFSGILGHEFVGVVEQATDQRLAGQRVAGEINAGCGSCNLCRSGMERHCPHRSVLGILHRQGAMAEYVSLPERNLIPVPASVPDNAALFVEPLAAAVEILEQVKIEPCHDLLVIGDGKLGLLTAMVLRLTGCAVTLVGKHEDKLALVRSPGVRAIGLDELHTTDERFDVVVEASGHPSGWDLAVQRIKPRGTFVLKSTYAEALHFNPAPIVINEVTIVGSRCGRFEPALRFLEQGLIDPLPLLVDIMPLDQAVEAFAAAQSKGTLKIGLRPDNESARKAD